MILGGGTIILFLKATIFNRDQKPFDQFYSKVFTIVMMVFTRSNDTKCAAPITFAHWSL